MHADGSGLTRVYSEGIISQVAVSQVGHRAAFVQQTRNADASSTLELYVISASDWKAQKIADVGLKDTGHYPKEDFEYEAFEAERAVTERRSIAWSPDGKYLAFISGQDGVSADLYVYAAATGEIRRLTDGPSHAYGISWSPDSQYIFHSGAVAFGTGAGITSAGAWVASVDGTEVIETTSGRGETTLLGWVSSEAILVFSWNIMCGAADLQEIHFKAGTSRLLWPGCMEDFHYDRQKGNVIITNSNSYDAWEDFSGKRQGTYLVTPGQAGFQKISDQGYEYIFRGQELAAWYGFIRSEGLFALDKDGQVIDSFTEPPYSNSRLNDFCFPDDDYLYLENWDTQSTDIIRLGTGQVASLTGLAESCYPSPADPDLIFSFGDGLKAYRMNEWQVQLVSEAIEYGFGIYWMP